MVSCSGTFYGLPIQLNLCHLEEVQDGRPPSPGERPTCSLQSSMSVYSRGSLPERQCQLQVDDAPFSDEAHGESWAQPLEDNINLDDGLAELGLGGDPNEVVGDDGLAELEDEVPAQYDDANYDANYDNAAPNYDDTMFMEAEEEAPKPMSAAMRKKQREHEEHLGLVEMVKVLCIKMEKALEDDADDVMKGQPGLRKLTMLNEVSLPPSSFCAAAIDICWCYCPLPTCCLFVPTQAVLHQVVVVLRPMLSMTWLTAFTRMQIEQCSNQVKAHPILLNSGILGILKGFLEPLMTPRANKAGDNLLALPHLSIRQLVYKILAALPIATHSQEGRNLLKASGIGPVLRFYAKVKHETEANRRTVGDLLNRWMLPIIEEGRKAVKDDQMEAERLRVCLFCLSHV